MALFSLLNSGFLIFYISIAKSRRIETSHSPFSFSFLPLKSFYSCSVCILSEYCVKVQLLTLDTLYIF